MNELDKKIEQAKWEVGYHEKQIEREGVELDKALLWLKSLEDQKQSDDAPIIYPDEDKG